MRSSIEIRLSLTDDEWSKVAMSAYGAHKPLHQWIKDQILAEPEPVRAEPEPVRAEPEPARAAEPQISEPEARAPEPVERLVEARPEAVRARQAPAQAALPARTTTPNEIIPKGFDHIVTLGERIVAGQAQARRLSGGKNKGVIYNRHMTDFYSREGLARLPTHIRTHLQEIGRRAGEIRQWHARIPIGTVPETVQPFALLRIIERNPVPRRPTSTLHFSHQGIKTVPVEEVFTQGTGQAAAEPEPARVEEPAFENFAQVDLNNLGDEDTRSIRRFTNEIVNLGGPNNLPQKDIALMIRKLRGKDKSITPKIAKDLGRLAVLAGESGDYHIRPEFTNRFQDVVTWLAQHH